MIVPHCEARHQECCSGFGGSGIQWVNMGTSFPFILAVQVVMLSLFPTHA